MGVDVALDDPEQADELVSGFQSRTSRSTAPAAGPRFLGGSRRRLRRCSSSTTSLVLVVFVIGWRRPPRPRTRVPWRRRRPLRGSRRRSAASRPRPARGRATGRGRAPATMRSASACASAMSCVQRRIVTRRASPAPGRMNSCTSSFDRRIEARRSARPAGAGQARSGAPARGRPSACMPRDRVLHRLAAPLGREADAGEDLGNGLARLARRHPVEPRRVREVLGRGHLLEEARLDRDAVDEPADRRRILDDVVAEDPRLAAVVDPGASRAGGRRRRLPRAILAVGMATPSPRAIVKVTSSRAPATHACSARAAGFARSRRRNVFPQVRAHLDGGRLSEIRT